MLVCPQNGRMTLWNKAISVESCIVEGYFSHPANLKPSLNGEQQKSLFLAQDSVVPKEITDLIRALKEATVTEVALTALEKLKQHPFVTALKDRIQKLESREGGIPLGKALEILETLKELQNLISSTFNEVKASFETPKPRLERLFHIKTLSSLLANKTLDVESAYSLLYVEPLMIRAEKALAYQTQLPFPSQLESLLFIGENALHPEGEKLWETFYSTLSKSSTLVHCYQQKKKICKK